jgi:multimeric flavodoxin WrbA
MMRGTSRVNNSRPVHCDIDDDVPAIVGRLSAAAGVVYVAPVHAFGLAHLMQIFLERAGVGYLRFGRPLANKVGGAVVLGRRYSHSQAHAQLLNNILLNRMIVVGSGYPVLLEGGAPGDSMRDTEGLDSLTCLLERMVSMIDLLGSLPDHADLLRPSTVSERDRPGIRLGTAAPTAR